MTTTIESTAITNLPTDQWFDVLYSPDQPSPYDFRCDTIAERLENDRYREGTWRYSVALRGGRLLLKPRLIDGVMTRRPHATQRERQGFTWPRGDRFLTEQWAAVRDRVTPHLAGPDELLRRVNAAVWAAPASLDAAMSSGL